MCFSLPLPFFDHIEFFSYSNLTIINKNTKITIYGKDSKITKISKSTNISKNGIYTKNTKIATLIIIGKNSKNGNYTNFGIHDIIPKCKYENSAEKWYVENALTHEG
ncbi:unnamed protein product, partial [marine sediment metagenome]